MVKERRMRKIDPNKALRQIDRASKVKVFKKEFRKRQLLKIGVLVRRERFKGKYYVTAREKGKIVSRRRWGRFSLKDGVKLYNQNKTLHEGYERRFLPNVILHNDNRGVKVRRSVTGKFQIRSEIRVDGELIFASSSMRRKGFDKGSMMKESIKHLGERVAMTLHVDTDEADKIVQSKIDSVKYGVVWFSKKR